MSKIDQYIDKVEVILQSVDFHQIESSDSISKVADELISTFSNVYGAPLVSRNDCVSDEGFALIPATIKTEQGKEYLALLDICVQDGGEHYGTQIFTKNGLIAQEDFETKLTKEELDGLFPYKYRPLISIDGDHHQMHQY